MAHTNVLNRVTFPVFVLIMATFVALQATKAFDGPISWDAVSRRVATEWLGVAVAFGVAVPFTVIAAYGFILSLGPKGTKAAFVE